MNTSQIQANDSFRQSYDQRRMRAIVNEAKMLVAGWHDETSHASHLDFIYDEWVRAETDSRRQDVRGQVEDYIRILNDYADRRALIASGGDLEASSLIDLRLPVSDLLPLSEAPLESLRPVTPPNQVTASVPPNAPQRPKKAGNMPLSPPPSPALLALHGIELSKSGNIDEEMFCISLDYMIEAMENSLDREQKMAAYVKLMEFIMTQPIHLMKNPQLRELTYENILSTAIRVPGHVGVEGLLNSFQRLFLTLRGHPYYVPHPSGQY